MQRNSLLFNEYATQMNNPIRPSEQFSPLHASIDPRFSNLLTRASIRQEKTRQQQVSPETYLQSPSTVTVSSNVWSPTGTPEGKPIMDSKKSSLSAAWKSRLQGLLVGLAVAAIAVGITLAVFLTRPSTSSTSSTTATTAPACSSLRWNESGVTVAGNGSYGNASNQFQNPTGIYVDSNYTVYVVDSSNHRVQQWLSNAVDATTVAGITGVSGSNNSLLYYPRAVYGDSRQNLYIADNYGIIVWPIGASAGNRIASSSWIGSIQGIYVDKNGYIYATFLWNCVVRMWTSTTATSTIVAGDNSCGYASSQLTYNYGLTVDSSTNTIYVANTNAHTIVAWPVGASNGTIVAGQNSTYGTLDNLLYYPNDVKRDSYGNLYVADSNNDRVMLFCQNPSSTSGRVIAGYQLSYPSKIELDSDLNLYVLTNNRVLKYARIS